MVALPALIVALVHASQTAAQDAAVLPDLAATYLTEVIAAAQDQAAADSTAGAAGISDLIAGDDRWVAPQAQSGIGPLIGHFAFYGAEAADVLGVQLAGEAARVTAAIAYAELPGTDWPVTVDFLWLDGKWKIREVEKSRRRSLPSDASPDDMLAAYLSDLRTAVGRHADLPPHSWLARALQSHWIAGGGGYWRRAGDCPIEQRARCMAAPLQGAGLWSALARDRVVKAEITAFRLHPESPSGELTITTSRRTYEAVDVFDVTLQRDKRHGWQIATFQRHSKVEAPDPVTLAVDGSSGLALVTSLLDALLGPEAPSQTELLADPGQISRYFTDSRAGRKAAAQTMNLPLMLAAMGVDSGAPTITAAGTDRVRVHYAADRGSARDLLFSLVSTSDGPKIREVQIE